jgi:hypothetical protein
VYNTGAGADVPITAPFTMPAVNITVTAQFEQIPQAAVTFTGYGEEKVNLAGTPDNDLSKAANHTITVAASGSGITIQSWWLDGVQITGTQSSKQFRAVDLTVGIHHVTVMVLQGGVPYSKEVQFKVTE